ncbi:hypothetical protein C8J57DRAFT_1497640 [Mycena rebaudengoi]|nr:hypothetical protein C8J57DRAFT_1497640 [Mycena rebaudengoi]
MLGRTQRMLEKKLGSRFTGTLVPGVRLSPTVAEPQPMQGANEVGREAAEAEAIILAAQMEAMDLAVESDSEWEDDNGEEAEKEHVAEMMETVLTTATDM